MTRQEAINVMEKYTYTNVGLGDVVIKAHQMAIDALEKQRWFSVTERLPEPHKDVLVAYRDFGEDTSIFIDCIEDNNGRLTWSTYNGAKDIIDAWMPLPEPYRPD